jgi:hypothetical protein
MIAHNIVLTVFFIVLAAACLFIALLGLGGGAQGETDYKGALQFAACAVFAAIGIVLVWKTGELSWLCWLYWFANAYVAYLLYRSVA